MPIVVSKETDWKLNQFVMVPISLVMCKQLGPNSRLLLIFLMNQVYRGSVSHGAIDHAIDIHRTTRRRCLSELRELGFIKGDENHIILCDPIKVLKRLKAARASAEKEVEKIIALDDVCEQESLALAAERAKQEAPQSRDYLKEATDAWNRYRPKDYKKINRISAQIIKAIDGHMRDLGVPPHDYEQFFSALKSGIAKSDFWSKHNTSKTLQSITGVGNPTDKKKGNVYALFNDGILDPAKPVEEDSRSDTRLLPAAAEPLITEYLGAQHSYYEAYQRNAVEEGHRYFVIKAEEALRALGLDPVNFRFKYGIRDWPTDTPEPEKPLVQNWEFDYEDDADY